MLFLLSLVRSSFLISAYHAHADFVSCFPVCIVHGPGVAFVMAPGNVFAKHNMERFGCLGHPGAGRSAGSGAVLSLESLLLLLVVLVVLVLLLLLRNYYYH